MRRYRSGEANVDTLLSLTHLGRPVRPDPLTSGPGRPPGERRRRGTSGGFQPRPKATGTLLSKKPVLWLSIALETLGYDWHCRSLEGVLGVSFGEVRNSRPRGLRRPFVVSGRLFSVGRLSSVGRPVL